MRGLSNAATLPSTTRCGPNTRASRAPGNDCSSPHGARRCTPCNALATVSQSARTAAPPAAASNAPSFERRAPTSPPPRLHDRRERLVYEWLQPNMKYLLEAAANELGFGNLRTSTRRCHDHDRDCLCIVAAVCKDERVRRCFCFATVSNAVFDALRHKLLERAAQHKVCVECTRGRKRCDQRTRMRFEPSTARNRDDARFEPSTARNRDDALKVSVKQYIGNVRASMPADIENEYWRVIIDASSLDHGKDTLIKYIEKHTKHRLEKNNKLQRKVLSESLDLNTARDKVHVSQSFIDGYNRRKIPWVQIMHKQDNRLLAMWSISHTVATRLGLCPCAGMLHLCQIGPTDKCHAFWKGRFLFAGARSGECFNGVALDTVLAVVWNADMTLNHAVVTGNNSCGSPHWRCTLSRVTPERWGQYVAPHNYSLSAFEDRSRSRFMPDAHIHLDCQLCYEALEHRSVLLNPL